MRARTLKVIRLSFFVSVTACVCVCCFSFLRFPTLLGDSRRGLTSRLVVQHPRHDAANVWRPARGRRNHRRGALHWQGPRRRHERVSLNTYMSKRTDSTPARRRLCISLLPPKCACFVLFLRKCHPVHNAFFPSKHQHRMCLVPLGTAPLWS